MSPRNNISFESELNIHQPTRLPGLLSHSFIYLDRGRTHYRLVGPENGQAVIIIHAWMNWLGSGIALQDELAHRGYRVLSYDLYGHGLSASPNARYDDKLFADQLMELVKGVLPSHSSFHIIAASLGTVVAASFAIGDPGRINSLTFVAPSGLGYHKKLKGKRAIFKFQAIGKIAINAYAHRLKNEKPKALQELSDEKKQAYMEYFNRRRVMIEHKEGLRAAMLSLIRHFPFDSSHLTYERLNLSLGTKVPIRIVYGEYDSVMPAAKYSKKFKDSFPEAEISIIPGESHFITTLHSRTLFPYVVPPKPIVVS